MSNEILKNETKFRQFLLGEMPETDHLEFEETFLTDEDLFENLRVAEDELIEDYIRGTLSNTEQKSFETKFLTTRKRHERVNFTRTMLGNLAEQSVLKKQQAENSTVPLWEKIATIFRRPQIAFASILAIFVIIFGGWFFLRNAGKPIDIAKVTPSPSPSVSVKQAPQTVETPQPIGTNANLTNQNVNLSNQKIDAEKLKKEIEGNLNNSQKNTNSEPKSKEQTKPSISTLALFAGGVRGERKNNELNLPKNSGGANLQLNLESQDYKTYRAEIVDQNGNVIHRSGMIVARNSKLNTFVPAKKLKRGDYIVKVYGKNAQGNEESVDDFQFRVNQQ